MNTGKHLKVGKHIFSILRKGEHKIWWCCTKRLSVGCGAAATSAGNNLISLRGIHNHEPIDVNKKFINIFVSKNITSKLNKQ